MDKRLSIYANVAAAFYLITFNAFDLPGYYCNLNECNSEMNQLVSEVR